jgi:hypothetical protein
MASWCWSMGLHQELGWSTSAGPAEMQLVIYGDNIENPMIEARGI